MIGIYCIVNLIERKRYVGQSVDMYRRLNDHKSSLRRNDHENVHLQRAWNKYGEDNFDFLILCFCDVDRLDRKESYYIKKFRTMNFAYGYNMEGGGNKNKTMSDETRIKISESRVGRDTMSSEAKQRLSERMKGNTYRLGSKMSEENKQKLIQVHKGNKYTLGHKLTDDLKKKLAERMMGNQYRKGIPHTEETKKHLSEIGKARYSSTPDE